MSALDRRRRKRKKTTAGVARTVAGIIIAVCSCALLFLVARWVDQDLDQKTDEANDAATKTKKILDDLKTAD